MTENKILYITYDGLLDPLGKSQVLPYLKGLSKKGRKFSVISYEKKYRFAEIKDVLRLKKELDRYNISWSPIQYHKKPNAVRAIKSILNGIKLGIKIIRSNNIKAIHARSYVAASVAYFLKRMLHKKFVFDMRGLWADERVDGGLWQRRSLLYKLAKYWEKKFLLGSDVIIVLTNRVKTEIKKFSYMKQSNIPIKVIPTCADLKKFKIIGKDRELITKYRLKDKFNLIYFGSWGTWYLLEEMLDFFKVLKSRKNNTHLILLINDELKEAEKLLYQKKLNKTDFTIQSTSYEEVPSWLSVADASIMFIKPVYSKIGSCPTKLGESLASGIPVIINSGIGDSDEIVLSQKGGVMVNDFSKEAYEKAIDELDLLLKQKLLKKRLTHTAKEKFSLNKGVKSYEEVYSYLH